MGCGSSKNNLETVDDSVHVMLAHDKKVAAKKGQSTTTGYKPRAQHPLLASAGATAGADSAAPVAGGGDASAAAGTTTTSSSSNENAPASAPSS
jgi:hypothetical protein